MPFIAWIIPIAFLVFSGCGRINQLPTIAIRDLAQLSASSSTVTSGWQAVETLDAGAYNVNNDLATSCTAFTGVSTRGCVQSPPIVYSDNRWHVGFGQNYLGSSNPTKFSLLVNMTSLTTKLFGTYGSGLGVIDNGSGISTAQSTPSSARYIRFAKLSNEDVVAVFMVEDPSAATIYRLVYANVYSSISKSWGAARQLSTTSSKTESGTDYSSLLTHLCRPVVSASGTTAIVAWCEDDGSTGSHIKYAKYENGSWATSAELANYSTEAYPGFSAVTQTFTGSVSANDVVSASLLVSSTIRDVATVLAVTQTPLSGQFQIVSDPSRNGTVLLCPTLQNMVNAILEKTTTRYLAGVASGSSTALSRQSVTAEIDPACSDASASNYRFTLYYNRGLSKIFRTVSGASISNSADGFTTTSTDLTINATSAFTTETVARRSAMVSIAADSYGNFGLVRSLVTPWLSSNSIATASMSFGRILVGHEYVSTKWLQRSSATTDQAAIFSVSQDPICHTAATAATSDAYVSCSARNPNFVISSGGAGLVLYYQNQIRGPNTLSDTLANPRYPARLYFATYSTATGFTTAAYPIDEDTYCLSNSVVNDTPVCEAQEIGGQACQSLQEGSATSQLRLNPSSQLVNLSHDLVPPVVAMNSKGQAIVAYHKRFPLGGTCTYVGIFVRFYDPLTGFETVAQLDNGAGNTLHAQVAINSKREAAVIYEEDRCGTGNCHYILLRGFKNSQWGPTIEIVRAESETNSMMPSVAINDDGDILATYSVTTSGVRRLYHRRYLHTE